MPQPGPDPVPPSRKGLREVDLLLPVAVAICVALGWYVVIDYERAVGQCLAFVPSLAVRVGELRLMMVLLSVGALGLAGLAARDARRRRRAEADLLLANEALARRMERRTTALASRTKALRESQLREKLAEREAEAAFAAGRVEAAGAYLHGVGNALSSLELEMLRLGKALDSLGRVGAAFDSLGRSIAAGDTPAASRQVAVLRKTVVDRALPRLGERAVALDEIKERMMAELERYRGEFERRGRPRPFVSTVRLDAELGAILDRMPRSAGYDPVTRDIAPDVMVAVRKQPFLAGLAALLRQSLDAATGAVTVRLSREEGGPVVLSLYGVPPVEVGEPAVAGFINYLNENGGATAYEPAEPGRDARLVVELPAAGATESDLS